LRGGNYRSRMRHKRYRFFDRFWARNKISWSSAGLEFLLMRAVNFVLLFWYSVNNSSVDNRTFTFSVPGDMTSLCTGRSPCISSLLRWTFSQCLSSGHFTRNTDCVERRRLELWKRKAQLHGGIDEAISRFSRMDRPASFRQLLWTHAARLFSPWRAVDKGERIQGTGESISVDSVRKRFSTKK